jgi:putative two-component system response regulator
VLKLNELLNAHITIIDDEPANVLLLERLLEQVGYTNIATFTDSLAGWEFVSTGKTDLLLLDLQMPNLSGFEILSKLQVEDDDSTFFPIMVLTADATLATKRQTLALGAQDFLTKPFEAFEVALRVKNLLRVRMAYRALANENQRLEAAVAERTKDLQDTQLEIVERLGYATEYRDDDTKAHTSRVGEMAASIASKLGFDLEFATNMRLAAQLHDVGKIGISDTILLKPGKLTDDEFETMKKHTEIGASILSGSKSAILKLAEEIALSHHERWDGRGYPHGIAGDDIPVSGRIVSVVDVFDALTHERSYKEAWPVAKAIQVICESAGTQFDPKVVDAFLTYLEEQDMLPDSVSRHAA